VNARERVTAALHRVLAERADRTVLIVQTSSPNWIVVYDQSSDAMDVRALETLGRATSRGGFAVAALVHERRGGRKQRIRLSVVRAIDAFRANLLLRVDGRAPGDVWNAISGFYRTADERFIQLHTNFSHHLERTLAVLDAVRSAVPRARVLAVTSAEIYGAVDAAELPIGEDARLRPLTVYGASKAAADLAAAQWGRAYGLDVVRARPFNHTGPGQDAAFVCAALARQIARIEAGRQEAVVHAGNLDPVRDFSDVRDVAAAYVALLERGQSGEVYNLCSGTGCSIAEVVAILRTHARVAVRVTSDPSLRRALDVPRLVGSHARATRDTGWEPRIAWSDTLATVLEDWRARAVAGG